MKSLPVMILHAMLISAMLFPRQAASKEPPLLPEKQGTFEFLSRTDYTDPQCGFSDAEIKENLKEIAAVVGTMRTNPVLTDLKGFDGRARIYTIHCSDTGADGIPSRISFEFASWFLGKDGKPARILIEPPGWDLIINKVKYGYDTIEGEPNYFMIPENMRTIRPGIDLYNGEVYVIYNPGRPAYWLPVTVRDCHARIIAKWKKEPDPISAGYMLKFIEQQYAAFPKSDLDKPAYYGSKAGNPPNIMSITADATGVPIMRVNPDYWNRKLPRSAIQFIYCRINGNRDYIRRQKEECLKVNSISYGLYRFLETLDVGTVESLLRHIRR